MAAALIAGWARRVEEDEKLRLTMGSAKPLTRWDARLGRKVA
jgi:hypothetical protein